LDDNKEIVTFEKEHSMETEPTRKILKSGSIEGRKTVRSSPMHSQSSIEQSPQQFAGKNKEYFDNLYNCYDPEKIAISPSPLPLTRLENNLFET
jgi:hypothetical protein